VSIDTSGIASLEELHKSLVSSGKKVRYLICFEVLQYNNPFLNLHCGCLPIPTVNLAQLAIANPRWQVIYKLKATNFVTRIEGRVFLTIGEAIDCNLDF